MTVEELTEIKREIEKEHGPLSWGSDEALAIRWLPLGIPPFDNALGGGFPFNRIVEVYGDFSVGKTTLALLAIKSAQAMGLSSVFVDVERSWNPDWAMALGVDATKLLVSQPPTGEAALDFAVAMVRRKVGVIVIDSLAALTPSAELEADPDEMFEKQFVGGQARLINRGLRVLTTENRGSCIILINQLREAVGIKFGNPETLPGGKGQNFYSTQRVRVRRGAWIEEGTGDDKKHIGYKMRIIVDKNKVGRPFEDAEVGFYFTGMIDTVGGLVDLAISLGAIRQDGAYYFIYDADGVELRKIYGKKALFDAVKDSDELQAVIRARLERVDEF